MQPTIVEHMETTLKSNPHQPLTMCHPHPTTPQHMYMPHTYAHNPQGATRALLGRLLDPERGIPGAIAACAPAYASREPATRQQAWVDQLVSGAKSFGDTLHSVGAALPGSVLDGMWAVALGLLGDAMTEGLSRVRKCTLEGRASMSLDVGYVEKGLKGVVPPGAMHGFAGLRRADQYVRAFYLPWDDFSMWCQTQIIIYGKDKLLPLVELVAEAHKVKRGAKGELVEALEAISADPGGMM